MRTLSGAVLVVVALLAVVPAADAAFPGRNGAIGFAVSGYGGVLGPEFETSGLTAKRVGGSRERKIVHCTRRDGAPSGDCRITSFSSPSYSRRGQRIVFDAGTRLALVSAEGGTVTLLPAVTSDDGDPAFSPDGSRVVFAGANDHGTTDLYVYERATRTARLIIEDAGEPAWSVRNEIAYVRNGHVLVASPDGHQGRFVTVGDSPDWAPLGGRLVVVRSGRMFVVGARGRHGHTFLPGVRDASDPVWSPNGRWIAFDRFESGVFAKHLGGPPAQLVSSSQRGSEGAFHSSFNPSWRPIR